MPGRWDRRAASAAGARPQPALDQPSRDRPAVDAAVAAPSVTLDVVAEVLAGVAAADAPGSVAAAVLAPLVGLPGVRAALVAQAPRRGADPVVLASAGYDCSTMAAGARLPAGAGLPVTEAVRTAAVHVVGQGPSWVAVPAGPAGALLLSCTGPPPDPASVELLTRLGGQVGAALARATAAESAADRQAVLEEALGARVTAAPGLLVHTRPYSGALSGDVVELVQAGTRRWLLVADACGRGASAAVPAVRLRAAFRACAPGAAGPAAVLSRLDAALEGGEEEFVTALVVLVEGDRIVLASAGHPAPLLVPGGRVAVRPAAPLGLRLDGPWGPAVDVGLTPAPGSLLVAATDGLVDRDLEVDLDAVVAGLDPGLDPEAVAAAVVDACAAGGPAQDDATLAVLVLGVSVSSSR